MKKIIAASNNKHKIKEIKEILKDTGYQILSLQDAGINIDPEENSETFEGNALIKAKAIAGYADCMIIADDSGLAVDCLDGKPGVRSKRFAGSNASDEDNNNHLITILNNLNSDKFTARFVCAIALLDENGREKTFRGTCEGEIVLSPAGNYGFGYDPYFFIPQFNKTMAQLTDDEKNSISHRGNALRKLKNHLENIE